MVTLCTVPGGSINLCGLSVQKCLDQRLVFALSHFTYISNDYDWEEEKLFDSLRPPHCPKVDYCWLAVGCRSKKCKHFSLVRKEGNSIILGWN